MVLGKSVRDTSMVLGKSVRDTSMVAGTVSL